MLLVESTNPHLRIHNSWSKTDPFAPRAKRLLSRSTQVKLRGGKQLEQKELFWLCFDPESELLSFVNGLTGGRLGEEMYKRHTRSKRIGTGFVRVLCWPKLHTHTPEGWSASGTWGPSQSSMGFEVQ